MKPLDILTPTEQVALYLEREILAGNLAGELPGMKSLSVMLGVNHKTVDGAVRALEFKGLVQSRGVGKKRSITPQARSTNKSLKVGIIPYDPDDRKHHQMIDARERLIKSGHRAFFTSKSLVELKLDISRIKSYTEKYPADAWIIQSASREILEWFRDQDTPAFALFGRLRNVSIAGAGTTKESAIHDAVSELYALGHRRIVMLVREEQCLPNPGPSPRAFLDALEQHGITPGRYNLPYWHDNSDDFRQRLNSLFQHTPPTALFIPEPSFFIAAQQHLAMKGIVAPRDVSMICHDPSPAFTHCSPEISHITFEFEPCIRNAVKWVKDVASGKVNERQVLLKSEFVRGGTIGPPPQSFTSPTQ